MEPCSILQAMYYAPINQSYKASIKFPAHAANAGIHFSTTQGRIAVEAVVTPTVPHPPGSMECAAMSTPCTDTLDPASHPHVNHHKQQGGGPGGRDSCSHAWKYYIPGELPSPGEHTSPLFIMLTSGFHGPRRSPWT